MKRKDKALFFFAVPVVLLFFAYFVLLFWTDSNRKKAALRLRESVASSQDASSRDLGAALQATDSGEAAFSDDRVASGVVSGGIVGELQVSSDGHEAYSKILRELQDQWSYYSLKRAEPGFVPLNDTVPAWLQEQLARNDLFSQRERIVFVAYASFWGNILHGDLVWEVRGGNPGHAAEKLATAVDLALKLEEFPELYAYDARIEIAMNISLAIQSIYDWGALPTELTGPLLSMTQAPHRRENVGAAFRNQIIENLAVFEQFRERDLDGRIEMLGGWGRQDWASEAEAWLYVSPLGRPLQNMDQQSYLEIGEEVAQAMELPFYEAKPLVLAIDSRLEELPRTRFFSRRRYGGGMLIAISYYARQEVWIDLLSMGVALEVYTTEHGGYPASLSGIVDTLGGSLPLDPFSGEPYHYRPQENRFLLYSVGANEMDDGGQHGGDGDLVWRGERKQPNKAASKLVQVALELR